MEESRRKVNALIELENDVQAQWKEEKIFEEDAGEAGRETYVATFPYPYVNGRFHLGHAFTVSKAEFAVSYQRVRFLCAASSFVLRALALALSWQSLSLHVVLGFGSCVTRPTSAERQALPVPIWYALHGHAHRRCCPAHRARA